MNKDKEKTYTVVVHEVGKKDQIREHVDQLCATILPTEVEMLFPEKFVNGTMSVEVILEK